MWSIQNPNRSLAQERTFVDNLDFTMASLAYMAANMIDYLLTIPGVENDAFREGNPLLREYIELFGAGRGILLCKLLTCIGVICAMRVIDLAHKENKTRLRAEYILYGGAILMTLSGCLWLL